MNVSVSLFGHFLAPQLPRSGKPTNDKHARIESAKELPYFRVDAAHYDSVRGSRVAYKVRSVSNWAGGN